MEIQTEREREPTVNNIERNAPETQVDTEVFDNQAGLKTEKETGIQTAEPVPEKPASAGHKSKSRKGLKAPTNEQLQRKQYITAGMDSDGSAAIEMEQAVTGAVDTVLQTGGTIRTAVHSSAEGIGKIHTMVKQGVRLGTARDVEKVAANIGSGIRTGMTNAVTQTGNSLLKTKIDKSNTTDTGTEAIKQGLTELRYVDNARKAVQNTARGSIKAARVIRNMPRNTKAQVKRIGKNVKRVGKAAKKTADVVRKVLSTKAGRIAAVALLLIFLIMFLINTLGTLLISAVGSLFSWLAPDGDTADSAIKSNIGTYLEQIQTIESEKQTEIDGIADSLSPEYRYDGSQITGLNHFGNSTLQPFDNNAVLAVLATQKFKNVQESNTADFHFTDDEIRNAVEQFYNLDYHYEYDYCPDRNCAKENGRRLSLANHDFSISGISYDGYADSYSVPMTGSTYSHASSVFTRLEVEMNGGGTISGDGWAYVSNGTWSISYWIGSGGYNSIDWSHFYMTLDTEYCNNPNHKHLYGQVENLDEAAVLERAGFSEDEKQIYQIYLQQIRAIGG